MTRLESFGSLASRVDQFLKMHFVLRFGDGESDVVRDTG